MVGQGVSNQRRGQAVYAADVLNDLVGDFVSGVMLFHEWETILNAGDVTQETKIAVQKISLFHLVLGLSKFEEFYHRFHQVIPPQYRAACKALVRELRQKGVTKFRNKCVGHIWDNDQQRPLVHSEIMARFDNITGGNIPAFLEWINDPKGNIYPSTVVSIVETVRDALMAQYCITFEEFIDR